MQLALYTVVISCTARENNEAADKCLVYLELELIMLDIILGGKSIGDTLYLKLGHIARSDYLKKKGFTAQLHPPLP